MRGGQGRGEGVGMQREEQRDVMAGRSRAGQKGEGVGRTGGWGMRRSLHLMYDPIHMHARHRSDQTAQHDFRCYLFNRLSSSHEVLTQIPSF